MKIQYVSELKAYQIYKLGMLGGHLSSRKCFCFIRTSYKKAYLNSLGVLKLIVDINDDISYMI